MDRSDLCVSTKLLAKALDLPDETTLRSILRDAEGAYLPHTEITKRGLWKFRDALVAATVKGLGPKMPGRAKADLVKQVSSGNGREEWNAAIQDPEHSTLKVAVDPVGRLFFGPAERYESWRQEAGFPPPFSVRVVNVGEIVSFVERRLLELAKNEPGELYFLPGNATVSE